jgi:O-6-methylguanine DNA methyltransferase
MENEIINTEFGLLKVIHIDGIIHELFFVDKNKKNTNPSIHIANKINRYFTGSSKRISLPFKLSGTHFQKLVWREIMNIPYGETRTYGEIAELIGHPKSYRAVANACGQNKLAIIIPCHRVVGINSTGGYYWGVDIKERLSEFEKN